MSGITDPESGLVFYEISHVWGHGVPAQPGYDDVRIFRPSTHAKNGVMAQRIRTVMHTGTHLNAPLHLIQRAEGVGEIPLDRCFGPGVVVTIPEGQWEHVTAADLAAAKPGIEAGDIVVIAPHDHRPAQPAPGPPAHAAEVCPAPVAQHGLGGGRGV